MIGGLHHVALRVVDVDAASARWCAQFGLHERERLRDRARLACDDEPPCLELIAGAEPGLDHTGWMLRRGVAPSAACAQLRAAGVDADLGVLAGGGGRYVGLQDPDGNAVHLLPWAPPASAWVEHTRPPSGAPLGHPRRLGHVNLLTGDVDAQVAFWSEVLGLALSDRLGAAGAWLRCSHFHHELAFVQQGEPGLHHLAFDVVDAGQLRMTLDHLGRHGRWLGWGPTRHGVGGNVAAYVRITEEPLFVELYCDMELLEPDHEPRVYPDDRYSSNTWGPLPPRSYFRFDAAAVASERDSLETLGSDG